MDQKYLEMFEEKKSVFKDKSLLNPLRRTKEIVGRDKQEKTIAKFLLGIDKGYLPTTLAIHGPPGTGKTLVTKKVCEEFSGIRNNFEYRYVNLKECKTVFSAGNEILSVLGGERKKCYEGLDSIFTGISEALDGFSDFVVLILDEIDKVKQDKNYSPNDFFYRLIRGEEIGKNYFLSLFLISNELLEIDLKLDSRVRSAFSGEEVFFPPYKSGELKEILFKRLKKAFRTGVLKEEVVDYGLDQIAMRSGDIRRTITLFRLAGELADEKGLNSITQGCVKQKIERTEEQRITNKISQLPHQHLLTISAITDKGRKKDLKQPVTSKEIKKSYEKITKNRKDQRVGARTLRGIINDLETMGLIETWVISRGRKGRIKLVEPKFNPGWVEEKLKKPQERTKNE